MTWQSRNARWTYPGYQPWRFVDRWHHPRSSPITPLGTGGDRVPAYRTSGGRGRRGSCGGRGDAQPLSTTEVCSAGADIGRPPVLSRLRCSRLLTALLSQIITRLHAHPMIGVTPPETFQRQRHSCCHGPVLSLHAVADYLAGVRGIEHSHASASPFLLSVIVDEVHVHRFTIDEAKDDTPVAGYSDTPLAAPITRQSMQSTAREGHVLRRTSVLQRSQQATNTCHSVQSSGIATLIEPPQPLVREPHARTVTCNVARCIVKYRPCRRLG